MKKRMLTCVFVFALAMSAETTLVTAQGPLYFPEGDESWQLIDPSAVGWDRQKLDAALDLAGERNSSGVVILHKGRIMAERYWELAEPSRAYNPSLLGTDADGHAIEDVASVQKSIVAVLLGMAQEQQFLSIDDPVSKYVGAGWSDIDASNEPAITIRHLIMMTSGLKRNLGFEPEPGTQWRYNTRAYHPLMPILKKATAKDRDQLTKHWITEPLGMSHSTWKRRRGGKNAF